MTRLITLFVLLFVITKAPCQTEKKYWMMGGSGAYSVQNEIQRGITVKGTMITFQPDLGYFFINRTAAGIKGSFQYSIAKYLGVVDKSVAISGGPFIRHYFLNDEKSWNLLAEAAYQYYNYSSNGNQHANGYTLSAGPVFFFNTAVGLEILANYENYNSPELYTTTETFVLSVGFQIHLHNSNN
jgi:hypothetical protein